MINILLWNELVWCSVCHIRHSHTLARKHLDNDPLGYLYAGKLKPWDYGKYDRECKKEALDETTRGSMPRL